MKEIAQSIELSLPVVFIKEGSQVVAYTPAFDISTVGKDESEARERFGELVNIFFKDLIENNTLEPVLSELADYKSKID
jgi:predicted RNase H-like HicB family nuclease